MPVEKKSARAIRITLCSLIAVLSLLAMFIPYEPVRSSSSVPAMEGPLVGHVIAVDAGHGGYDGGAHAPGGRWEKAYNLDIALRLRDYLHSLGATVVMTRDGDYALCDPKPKIRKKRQDMERRADLVLVGGAEVLVSIHMNEYRDRGQSGPQVFYRPDCPAGTQFASVLQNHLVEALVPKRARTALSGDFYITSLGIPSALVECGFLSNTAEEALLRTDAYCDRVAAAIGDGIAAWFAMEEHPEAAVREER